MNKKREQCNLSQVDWRKMDIFPFILFMVYLLPETDYAVLKIAFNIADRIEMNFEGFVG